MPASINMTKGVAAKTNPLLWEMSKVMACKKGNLCKHSARKMQWAVQFYRKNGGTYTGGRKSSNKLHQWTKQRWRTASRRKSEGRLRYLPDKAWSQLSSNQIARTNKTKLKGFLKGKQWVKQPKDVVDVSKKYRKLTR